MNLSVRALPAILAAVFLTGVSHVPAAAAQATCTPCNGYRYQVPGTTAVYLVIDGVRHHVPDERTYFNLWRTWDGILPGGTNITVGDPLLSNSYLGQEDFWPYRVYLVGRSKRWIPSPAIFDQYAFDWAKIQHPENMPGAGPDIPGR
ncbi:hypothetical protein SAMN04489727_7681 [Amycolatopsis tolypomycina]|uniref:Uncharacterized protein n=1 Tax=Amycolatopsis tolypomycina TaxID=208445 RepID=A0A1H5AC83_9PSEU|nr:hypothetical protein [Amycolatopsis tolypomycina]SED39190.1 hypothetical protein SAMN04489727_7681 [Amycolatopsis tolypomycina]